MSWLVTGGAGYIGSHVVQAFLDAGIVPVVVDDLSSGHAEFVPDGVPWAHLDIAGPAYVEGTPWAYNGKGATGYGVRTLVAVAERMADQQD